MKSGFPNISKSSLNFRTDQGNDLEEVRSADSVLGADSECLLTWWET